MAKKSSDEKDLEETTLPDPPAEAPAETTETPAEPSNEPTPEETAAAKEVEAAEAELQEAQQAHVDAAQVVEEKTAKVEEAKAALEAAQPPKVYFVRTRDEVYEAKIIKENEDGTADLEIPGGVLAQKFVSGASSGVPATLDKPFLKVRKGFGKNDIGSYFIE